MLSNAMIDVALGLILMYLVLSLVCTMVNESIASFLDLRAKTLRTGIDRIIDNDKLRNAFYSHGLIEGVCKSLTGKLPSYISGRAFSTALLDSLDPSKPLVGFKEAKAAIEKLPKSNIRDALITGLADGAKDIEALRTHVATWFDSTMDRVSGIYKRRMQWVSFLIGLTVAVGINADSYTVAKALWADEAMRNQIAGISSELTKTSGETEEEKMGKLGANISALRENLRPLPIGWSTSPARPDHGWMAQPSGWASKTLGWIFTALAIMLGAPFWFDLLNRFVRIRATGVKPTKVEG